jgi:hypothetical protein
MPHPGTSAGYVFIGWCCLVIVVCIVLALKPARLFGLLAWRRSLPKALEKRWVVAAYRVTAVAILLWVVGLLIEFGRS